MRLSCRLVGTSVAITPIPVTDEVVSAAARLKRSAVETLLRAHYPRVCRIAYAICGRHKRGHAAAQIVMSRSLHILPSWQGQLDAANWFLHHTVIVARNLTKDGFDPRDDCLLPRDAKLGPEYVAFIAALRKLPSQQQEAFLLSVGEKLDARGLAISMDCSTAAASTHLSAARQLLLPISSGHYDALSELTSRAYAALTPAEELVIGDVNVRIGKHLARRRLRRFIGFVTPILLMAALGWIIWRLSKMIII